MSEYIDVANHMHSEHIERTKESCRRHRILSTLPYTKIRFWNECVDTYSLRPSFIKYVIGLIKLAPRYDLVLLTGGERFDLIYLAVAGLLPWIKTPHVIADAHWQKADGLLHFLQRAILRCGRRLAVQVQPHSQEEISIYHKIYGIPSSALKPVPWSPTLTGHNVSPATPEESGDFILTGGKSFRDYDTLFKAIAGLDIRVEVGLPAGSESQSIIEKWRDLSSVVFYTSWSNAQFIRKIAGCRLFVMPISGGLTRSTADQTILNAMYFGKIVIATSSIGSRIYIKDGVNGFLVQENSVDDWRDAILKVLSLTDAEIKSIGARAAYDAQINFSEPMRLVRTLESALKVL